MTQIFDYTTLWNDKASLFPSITLILAILSLWQKNKIITYILTTTFLISGLITAKFNIIALIFIVILFLLFYFFKKPKNKLIYYLLFIITLVLAIAFLLHIVPGFNNWKIISDVTLSKDSIPFSMFINFDKPMVGLVIYLVYIDESLCFQKKLFNKNAMFWILFCLIFMILLSLKFNYMRFDFKVNNLFFIWAVNNLFLCCVIEELFFRGWLQVFFQDKLQSIKYGSYIAILIAALLFGLIHFRGGYVYILLATIAGIFYGIIYLKTKRIENSIILHFLLNSTHFIGFSYPRLML